MNKLLPVLGFSLASFNAIAAGNLPVAAATAAGTSNMEAVSAQINRSHTGYTEFTSPLTFPLKQIWTVSPGKPVTTPLIAEGKVFEIFVDPDTNKLVLYAFAVKSGTRLWGPVTVSGSAFTYDNGHLYDVSGLGLVQAIDAHTGQLGWSVSLPYNSFFGASPVAANGVIYLSGNGYAYALSETDGSQIWNQYFGGDSTIPTLTPTNVVITYPSAQVSTFKRSTGHEQWSFVGGGGGGAGSNVAGAAYANGQVYVADLVAGVTYAFNSRTGAVDSTYPFRVLPTIAGTTGLFLDTISNTVSSVDLTTHAVRWSYSGGVYWLEQPIQVNQDVFIADSMGNFSAFDASTGSPVWKIGLGINGGIIGYNAGEEIIAVANYYNLVVFH